MTKYGQPKYIFRLGGVETNADLARVARQWLKIKSRRTNVYVTLVPRREVFLFFNNHTPSTLYLRTRKLEYIAAEKWLNGTEIP